MSTNSVFMKKTQQNYKICYESILKTIPDNSYTEPQNDKNDKVEMRWRFLHIPTNSSEEKNKKMVEISKRRPGGIREFLNKQMEWIVATVDPYFDQYVTKQYYYYSDQ